MLSKLEPNKMLLKIYAIFCYHKFLEKIYKKVLKNKQMFDKINPRYLSVKNIVVCGKKMKFMI